MTSAISSLSALSAATTAAAVSPPLCTTQVFSGARELAQRSAKRNRRERGVDEHIADEIAQNFERMERAELRRLFFAMCDET